MVGNSSRKPLPQSLSGRFAHDSARSSRHMPSEDGQILRNLRSHPMTAADFRRIALSLERVEDYSHAGWPAFGCDPSAVTMWLRVRLTSAEFAAHSKRSATRRTPNGEYLLRGGFLSLSPLVSDLQWNRESLRIFPVGYRDTNSWKMWWSIETG
jgi:hypothetical protein